MDGEPPTVRDGEATIRILATTDLHAAIRSYDYGLRRPDPSRGLSRIASLVRRLRADAATVFVDNGDFLFGDTNAAVPDGSVTGVVAAMNAAGYDAALLGNHEFDQGRAAVETAMGAARFPFLCANLAEADGSPFALPHMVLSRAVPGVDPPVRLGLVGFLPPEAVGAGGMPKLGTLKIGDVARSLETALARLSEERVDLVLALCHGGLGGLSERAVRTLAASGGVDALVLGHVHTLFPGPDFEGVEAVDVARGEVSGVPAVMPGFLGRHLGRIDLRLERRDGGWRAIGHEVALHPVCRQAAKGGIEPQIRGDPAVLRASRTMHLRALEIGNRVVGATATPLTSYFGRIGYCPATMLVARAQRQAVERALPAHLRQAGHPVVGLAASKWAGGLGGPLHYIDIAAGPLVEADLQRLCSFPDRVVGVEATGADLRDWLERTVSAFTRIGPGTAEAGLVDPRFPPTDFDLPERVRFTVDLSRPARFDAIGRRLGYGRGRVSGLSLDGAPIADETPLILAITDFRAYGGGHFPAPATTLFPTGTIVRDAVGDLVLDEVAGTKEPSFDFAPVAAATAIFRTGPGAAAHLGDLAGRDLEPLGIDAEGFAAYRLHLGARP